MQETMRSDSSAGSGSTPDLAAGPMGPALQPSQQVQRQMWLCELCAGSPGAQPATLKMVPQKYVKTHNSACLCSIASKPDLLLSES